MALGGGPYMSCLKRIGAAVMVVAMVWVGYSRMAAAQTTLVVTTQGVLGSVSDDGNGMTLTVTLTTPSGVQLYTVSRANTSVWAGNERISPTALDHFIGTPAIVLSAQVGTQQVAGRINLLVFPVQGEIGPAISINDDHANGGGAGNGGNGGGGNGGGGGGNGGGGGGNGGGGGGNGGGGGGNGGGGGGNGGGGGGNGGGGGGNGGGGGGNGGHGNGEGNGNGHGIGEGGDNGHGDNQNHQ
jgi:hypothetical protein